MDKRTEIYDELSRVLTDFENDEAGTLDLYRMLVKIQNEWGDITAMEDIF